MIFRNNVDLGPPLKLSGWRKIAIGTWRTAADPSVYGVLDLDAEPALRFIEKLSSADHKITMTHFVGRVMGVVLKRHPEVNCVLRWGRLYPRRSCDVFFQVATDMEGKDLSGIVIREVDRKTTAAIAEELREIVDKIRSKKDPSFKKMKTLMASVPGLLAGFLIELSSRITYTLNLWNPLIGTPRDPFGGCMVTSIGSLGLDFAFAPLVPYSRVPLLVAVGRIRDDVAAVDGQIKIVKKVRICATFDHRLIDGVHAAKMAKSLEQIFSDPEKELGE